MAIIRYSQAKIDKNKSELKVLEAIQSSPLTKDWTLLHGVEISHSFKKKDEEIDFVVLIPEQGIVVIEVKGARTFSFDENGVELKGIPDPHKNPFDQARTGVRNLKHEMAQIELPVDEIPMARLVWLPEIHQSPEELSTNRPGRGFMNYEIAFQSAFDNPYQTIENALLESSRDYLRGKKLKLNPQLLGKEEIKAIVQHLIPEYRVSDKLEAKKNARERELRKASEKQSYLISMIRDNAIVYFSGPAGSGKSKILTQLALDARSLGHKVLVTCHNIMMASWLSEQLGHPENLKVIAFDDLLLEMAGFKAHKTNGVDTWYNQTLPKAALEKLKSDSSAEKYSTIIIDEFQDLAINDLKLQVLKLLRGKQKALTSRIYIAGDDDQQIMNGSMPVYSVEVARQTFGPLTHIELKSNVRQSPELSNAVYKLLNRKSPFESHAIDEGLTDDLEVIHVTAENQAKRLAMVLERLEKDFPRRDIRVLHFQNENATLTKVFENRGNLASKDERMLVQMCKHATNPTGEIRWRSIRKFKGLDQDAIVITDISNQSAAWVEKELKRSLEDALYVGMTRARFKVVLMVQDELFEPTHNADGSVRRNQLQNNL